MDFFDPAGFGGKCLAKICGVRRAEDAARCHALGAAAVGINFWSGSKRFVDPDDASGWLTSLPPGLARIGVFVDPDPDEALRLLDAGRIDAAQLHGNETAGFCRRIREAGHRVIKAIPLRDRDSLGLIDRFGPEAADMLLLDAFAPGVFGGTGQVVDWALAREAVHSRPGRRVILSGGLTPDNVREAVQRVRPFAVDVASGVEIAPGIKDWERVERFLLAVDSCLPSPGQDPQLRAP